MGSSSFGCLEPRMHATGRRIGKQIRRVCVCHLGHNGKDCDNDGVPTTSEDIKIRCRSAHFSSSWCTSRLSGAVAYMKSSALFFRSSFFRACVWGGRGDANYTRGGPFYFLRGTGGCASRLARNYASVREFVVCTWKRVYVYASTVARAMSPGKGWAMSETHTTWNRTRNRGERNRDFG